MKQGITFIIISLWRILTLSLVNAQPTPQFESLRLSSAPSFVILGVEPENISRPVSPTEFVSGIQNAISEGKLKPNFAMEFTPYYFRNPVKDPTRFNGLKYIVPERNVLQNLCKTFSISLGTSESDTTTFGELAPGTALGIGIRFTIVEGKPNSSKLLLVLEWNEAMVKLQFLQVISILVGQSQSVNEFLDLINKEAKTFKEISHLNSQFNLCSISYSRKVIDDLVKEVTDLAKANGLDTVKKFINDEGPRLKQVETEALKKINTKTYPFAKQGFLLEMAAAEAILFENSEWRQPAHAKAAIWITPSYRWDVSDENSESVSLLDIMGVLRYTLNNKKDSVDMSNYFDAGAKCKFTHNRWSASGEGVYRYATEVDSEKVKENYTYRLTASFDYKINELLTLKANLGTTFNGNTSTYTDPKKVFAIAGINLNLFK
jgi:hypothetical protein